MGKYHFFLRQRLFANFFYFEKKFLRDFSRKKSVSVTSHIFCISGGLGLRCKEAKSSRAGDARASQSGVS